MLVTFVSFILYRAIQLNFVILVGQFTIRIKLLEQLFAELHYI